MRKINKRLVASSVALTTSAVIFGLNTQYVNADVTNQPTITETSQQTQTTDESVQGAQEQNNTVTTEENVNSQEQAPATDSGTSSTQEESAVETPAVNTDDLTTENPENVEIQETEESAPVASPQKDESQNGQSENTADESQGEKVTDESQSTKKAEKDQDGIAPLSLDEGENESHEPDLSKPTDYGIAYGNKDAIDPENLLTKVFTIYDKDTGEVIERHTFYFDKTKFSEWTGASISLSNFMNWYAWGVPYYGYSDVDENDVYNDLNEFEADPDQTELNIGVTRDTTPRLKNGDFYFERIGDISNENNLDPARFIGNAAALPSGTNITWVTAPEWTEDEHGLQLLNGDQVEIKVEVPGKEPVYFKASDRLYDPYAENPTLAEQVERTRNELSNSGISNTIEITLGELPDAKTFFHPTDETNNMWSDPVWGINPNVGRVGYTFGWIGFPELGSDKTMVLVKVVPKKVTQNIIYQDVSDNHQVGSTSVDGQITNLYYDNSYLSKDDLKNSIDGNIPEGYQIVTGYAYPAENILLHADGSLAQIIVPVFMKTEPKPDPKPDPEPDPTPDPEPEPTPDPTPTPDPEPQPEPQQPEQPVEPHAENPQEPAKEPETKHEENAPVHPTHVKVTTLVAPRVRNEVKQTPVNTAVKPANVKAAEPTLPQTGNKSSLVLTALGIFAIGLGGMILRKRRS